MSYQYPNCCCPPVYCPPPKKKKEKACLWFGKVEQRNDATQTATINQNINQTNVFIAECETINKKPYGKPEC